jgi:uncharacterized protein YjbI with pentapeptide repeats
MLLITMKCVVLMLGWLTGADLTKMNGGAASFAMANLTGLCTPLFCYCWLEDSPTFPTGANMTKMNGRAACFENANLSGVMLLPFHF